MQSSFWIGDNFPLVLGGSIAECEIEVAKCLLDNAARLDLTDEEIDLAKRSLQHYGKIQYV